MDIKSSFSVVKRAVSKYKFAAIVLVIGLVLLLFPGKEPNVPVPSNTQISTVESINAKELEKILQSIDGAGEVQVLLSIASGEETIYQNNTERTADSDKIETVITTDSNRSEAGLITQVNPPVYLGAIVVCEGADKTAVKYAIMQAVGKITGLGSDKICVLKMK